ncbi:MAG TPA: 3-deoxy-manno-octulosonate cytidylyltransferase [Planctomycetaceae bacterium]|nr:3-deoxy-manno-octulosonate cytidylyltransferase [Planctomycetaceae bacterium]
MTAVGIIPARLASSRLPRKLLLDATGQPLIQHTWEAARRARSLADVIVATDSDEIAAAVRRFGGRAERTGEHSSGTDRIAEVVRRGILRTDVIVNIQGDEPEIDPSHIDCLVETLLAHPQAETATLATPIRSLHDLNAPSCVKVVCAADGRALYFSRAPIPHVRDAEPQAILAQFAATEHRTKNDTPLTTPWLLHLGLYAYRREFLLKLTERPPSRLEQWEKLEQLRVLEAGATMQVAVVDHRSVGIDTPDDYVQFVARVSARAA